MAKTEITGDQILDGTVNRDDLDTTTSGGAVISKVIAGTNVTLTYTGADPGTGDVTINFVGGGGGGAPVLNARADVKPGIEMHKLVLQAIIGYLTSGVAISQSPVTLRIDQKPATLITTSASGSAALIDVKPAQAVSLVTSGSNDKPQSLPAGKITRVQYNLTRLVGGNAVALTTTNTQGWASEANAISGTNGLNDGSSAVFTGNALATRNGTITLNYPDSATKLDLVISSVILRFYMSTAGTVLNNADVQLKYNIGAGLVALETITGDVASLTTPRSFDITSAVIAGGVQATIWGRIDALLAQVTCDAALAETWTCNLDAIVVEIIAARTDNY